MMNHHGSNATVITSNVSRITVNGVEPPPVQSGLSNHHYAEPGRFLKHYQVSPKVAADTIADKYDQPIVNRSVHRRSSSSARRTASKLKQAKSMGALDTSDTVSTSTDTSSSVTNQNPVSALDENDLVQIELSFKAHKTFVYVCRCMANLYFTRTDLINGGRVSSPRSHEWELARTGIPVIIFDKGETRSRDRRQLQIALAERGTGFALWKDIVDNLTDYKPMAATFHTLYVSCDHRQMAGLSFDCPDAAEAFARQIAAITSDPLNIALSAPKREKVKGPRSRSKSKTRPPKKSDISSPCLFQHVTSVELSDFDRLYSMSSLTAAVRGIELDSPTCSQRSVSNGSSLRSFARSSVDISSPVYTSPTLLSSLPSSSPSPVASSSSASSENSSNFSL